MSHADALRILAYEAHFPDLGAALALIGYRMTAPSPGAVVPASHLAAPGHSTQPDDEEHVVSESLDGWSLDIAESRDAPVEPGLDEDRAEDLQTFTEGHDRLRFVRSERALAPPRRAAPPAAAGPIEDSAGRSSRPSVHPPGATPRIGDTRQAAPRVIAHVLEPRATAAPRDRGVVYRSIPRPPRERHWRPPRSLPDEAAWRTAAESAPQARARASGAHLDVPACVDRLAGLQPLDRLPTRRERQSRGGLTLLVDRVLALGPLAGDARAVATAIEAQNPRTVRMSFHMAHERLDCGAGPVWTWEPADPTTMGLDVVVITTIPPYRGSHLAFWRDFADELDRSGRRFTLIDVGRSWAGGATDWPGRWITLEHE